MKIHSQAQREEIYRIHEKFDETPNQVTTFEFLIFVEDSILDDCNYLSEEMGDEIENFFDNLRQRALEEITPLEMLTIIEHNIFRHCPLLSDEAIDSIKKEFLAFFRDRLLGKPL